MESCVTTVAMDSRTQVPDLAEACDAQRRDVQRVPKLLDPLTPARTRVSGQRLQLPTTTGRQHAGQPSPPPAYQRRLHLMEELRIGSRSRCAVVEREVRETAAGSGPLPGCRWLSAACETAAGCFEVPGCRSACADTRLVRDRLDERDSNLDVSLGSC